MKKHIILLTFSIIFGSINCLHAMDQSTSPSDKSTESHSPSSPIHNIHDNIDHTNATQNEGSHVSTSSTSAESLDQNSEGHQSFFRRLLKRGNTQSAPTTPASSPIPTDSPAPTSSPSSQDSSSDPQSRGWHFSWSRRSNHSTQSAPATPASSPTPTDSPTSVSSTNSPNPSRLQLGLNKVKGDLRSAYLTLRGQNHNISTETFLNPTSTTQPTASKSAGEQLFISADIGNAISTELEPRAISTDELDPTPLSTTSTTQPTASKSVGEQLSIPADIGNAISTELEPHAISTDELDPTMDLLRNAGYGSPSNESSSASSEPTPRTQKGHNDDLFDLSEFGISPSELPKAPSKMSNAVNFAKHPIQGFRNWRNKTSNSASTPSDGEEEKDLLVLPDTAPAISQEVTKTSTDSSSESAPTASDTQMKPDESSENLQ